VTPGGGRQELDPVLVLDLFPEERAALLDTVSIIA